MAFSPNAKRLLNDAKNAFDAANEEVAGGNISMGTRQQLAKAYDSLSQLASQEPNAFAESLDLFSQNTNDPRIKELITRFRNRGGLATVARSHSQKMRPKLGNPGASSAEFKPNQYFKCGAIFGLTIVGILLAPELGIFTAVSGWNSFYGAGCYEQEMY